MNANNESSTSTRTTTVGLDFGTSSVRACVVDVTDGRELGHASVAYPHGVDGVVLSRHDPHLARQHPGDYVPSACAALRGALDSAMTKHAVDAASVVGIGVATTGSSPMPVDRNGTPLAMLDRFDASPAAMVWLWKDHTAHEDASRINDIAASFDPTLLDTVGGRYSSEWYWAKLAAFIGSASPDELAACAGWVELADYVPGVFVGRSAPDQIARGVCAAGHKALHDDRRGGLPSHEFLEAVQPGMGAFRWTSDVVTSDQVIGLLTDDIAGATGLSAGIPVMAGAFDAHFGAVGGGVTTGVLVKNIGTSTCDCTVADDTSLTIGGLCGSVVGSITPGQLGLEAGQSAVGDIFAWFSSQIAGESIDDLTESAARLAPGASGLLALDWHNGNRTVLVDPLLTGMMIGTTLSTTRSEMFRALLEATAFGARRIIEQFEDGGVGIERIVAAGGIAQKSPLLVQIYADVTNRPIDVAGSTQAAGLGGAMFAAVGAGVHATVADAQAAMLPAPFATHDPEPSRVAVYDRLYREYVACHDAFGGVELPDEPTKGLGSVMKNLIAIRDASHESELTDVR